MPKFYDPTKTGKEGFSWKMKSVKEIIGGRRDLLKPIAGSEEEEGEEEEEGGEEEEEE